MKRRYRSIKGWTPPRGLAVALLFAFCLAASRPIQAQSSSIHHIAEINGKVQVKPAGWSKFVPATLNMPVKNGDLFRLKGKASSKVTCADLHVVLIDKPSQRLDCGSVRSLFTYRDWSISGPRTGGFSFAYPVIIAPRMTLLLDARPTLRWTAMAGTSTYRVSIYHGPVEQWAQEVKGITELKYPEDAPALVPRVTYRLVVSAGGHNSGEEKLQNLGFALMDSSQARAVREIEKRIRALSVPEPAIKFQIANLYAGWVEDPKHIRHDTWRLTAESIELLEGALGDQPEVSLLHMLGDLYLDLGLTTIAEKQYRRALEISEATDDVPAKALAQYDLGRIFIVRYNRIEARKRLQTARELFQSFGDYEFVNRVDRELASVPK